jgi:protein kinase-like protein
MDRDLEVGQQLGPYEILREIARGGQGAVFEGRHPQTGLRVALKVLTDSSPVERGRFLQEAQVLARLRHPNLPQIFEVAAEGETPWFALELIEGRDLDDWVLQAGLPEPRAIVEVLSPIARALDYCHQQGIVHRDLKPRNILLETRTKRPVLADFGLVQRDASQMNLEAVDALGRLSMTHEVKGTPSYMAPEQADTESFGGTGPRTDVYALGATLYFLLTGSPPQEGQSVVNVMVQLLKRTEAPDPLAKNAAADPALSEVCRRCLRTEPSERYGSALEVGQALDSCVAAPRSGAWVGALLLACVLAVLGLVVGALSLARPAPTPTTSLAVLNLSVDADDVEVFRGGERLGAVSSQEALRLELTPGAQRLELRRGGASLELTFDLPRGESAQSVELWREVSLETGTPAKGSLFAVGRDAPARDDSGRSLHGLSLPARVRLPLGRYRASLRAEGRHPLRLEFTVAPNTSLPDMKLRGEIRWRKKIPGTLWVCRPGVDLDGDGTGDVLLHAAGNKQPERVLALSGRDGRELWPKPAPINLWGGSYVQEEPQRAVVAVRGKGPTSLVWLDPATGRELRAPFTRGQGREQTFYGIAGFEGGRRGLVFSRHFYDERLPGRELIHVGPAGEERGRLELEELGAKAGRSLRASYPAPFDLRGTGRAKVVLWRFHRTYYLIELGKPSRLVQRYEPPEGSAAIRNHRNWWAVGDSVLRVRDAREAILTWIGQEAGQGIQSYLSLLAPGPERRWTIRQPGFYAWGRWLELRSGPVFAALFLVHNSRRKGRLVLIDPEGGEILRQVEVNEGLIGPPSLLRSRKGVESVVLGTYRPSLVRLLDARSLASRWSRSFRNDNDTTKANKDVGYEVLRSVADLDRDGSEELVVVRSRDGEVVVVDPLFDE